MVDGGWWMAWKSQSQLELWPKSPSSPSYNQNHHHQKKITMSKKWLSLYGSAASGSHTSLLSHCPLSRWSLISDHPSQIFFPPPTGPHFQLTPTHTRALIFWHVYNYFLCTNTAHIHYLLHSCLQLPNPQDWGPHLLLFFPTLFFLLPLPTVNYQHFIIL